jgi:hypothetical protein
MNGCLTVVGILFLLPFVAFIAFIIKLVMKGKNEGWKGTITDKSHNSKRGSFEDHHKTEHFYSFTVKMTDGKERKIAVSSQFYGECQIGDTIEKPKGSLFPKKL